MTEPKTKFFITPVVITVMGTVYSKPRLVRRRDPSDARILCEFAIKFKDSLYPEESFPDVESEFMLRKFEDKIRGIFESDGIYTDRDGVLQSFEAPLRRIWWVEVGAISTKALKPIPLPADWSTGDGPRLLPSVTGPIVDMELTKPAEVQE